MNTIPVFVEIALTAFTGKALLLPPHPSLLNIIFQSESVYHFSEVTNLIPYKS